MKGVKFISFFAACGFVLSFLFGFFSHTSFISVLLKALLFGLIFGILGLLINIVFEKFLADDTGDFSNEYSSEDSSSGVKKSSSVSKGQLVDITIEDEELEKSDGDNHFVVGDNHQMLTDSDVKGRIPAAQGVPQNNPGFVPLKNVETVNNLAGKEAVASSEVTSGNTDSIVLDSSNDNGIDTLPDMNHLDLTSENDDSNDEIDTDTDSEFVSTASSRRNDGEVPEIKDAGLMAKAISSILSDENSM